MKIISNFEILFNRIAPLRSTPPATIPDPNSGGNAIARKIVQGHFLTISNTELQRSIYFKVKYTYGNNLPSSSVAPDIERELKLAAFPPTSSPFNSVLAYDGGSLNNEFVVSSTATGVNIPGGDFFVVSTKNLRLRAGETGLLALLPFIQPTGENSLTDITPSLEVRGFITIEQVADAQYINSAGVTITETNPFVNQPANVVISSEHRGTFVDNDFDGTKTEIVFGSGIRVGFDFDQLAYALPLAEGKSLYTLDGA